MAEFTSYEPGTPCWVELGSSDIKATVGFYAELFGWRAEDQGPEAGNYHVATVNGKRVCGISPLMMEGQPTVWSTYISVENADKTTELAAAAGATVLVPPMDVMSLGRMAVFLDSTGSAISVWQPIDMAGAELANEPGAFAWNELDTRDVEGAKAFYNATFGWTAVGAGEPEYFEWKNGDKTVGGMMPMPAQVPAGVPNNWLVYFAVDDCDASTAKVQNLGGTVLVEPMTIPAGRFSAVAGLMQEPFGIIRL
ncbi:MAG: VOC family protein [Actinomycetes bacterium]